MREEKMRLMSFLHSPKMQKAVLTAGLVGIGLIALSVFLPSADKHPSVTAATATAEYAEKIEQRLTEIVASIEGAGSCRVMVTLENGVEYIYATEEKANTNEMSKNDGSVSRQDDTEQAIIVVDTGDGKQGLLVTEIQPTVKGVAVVCEGGDQPLVQERVLKAVTTVLNISSSRVCVTKLST